MALIDRDSNGQLWQITVNPDGSETTTPVVGDGPTYSTSDGCTVTLQSVVDLCRTHVELMPLASVGGFSQEPALSLANDTIQELCSAPYDWKFNAADAYLLVTQPYRQDYLFAGASAFVVGASAASIAMAVDNAITQSGFTTTVRCLQPHGFSVGQTVYHVGCSVDAFNSTRTQSAAGSGWSGGWPITAVPDAYSYTFTHAQSGLAVSGASGIYDFGWLQSASMYDLSASDPAPRQWHPQAVKSLRPGSQVGIPEKIAVMSQSGGVLSVRIANIPGTTTFGITLRYQKKPPLKTDLVTNTWAPFPDEFGFVYRQMFLARCYRYLDHRRADAEAQKAQIAIAKAIGKDDTEESDQYVTPERSLMGDWPW